MSLPYAAQFRLLPGCLSVFFSEFVVSWTLFRHSAFVRFDGPIFETENSSKTCAPQGASPVGRDTIGVCCGL